MTGDRDPQQPRLIPLRTGKDVEQDRFTDRLTTIVLIAVALWFGLPTLRHMLAGGF